MNRVTSQNLRSMLLADISRSQRSLAEAQRQISSGKRVSHVSDSPADAVASLEQRARLNRSTQLGRNAQTASRWLAEADQSLSRTVDGLTRSRTLVTQALSGAADPTARQAIADELRSLRESMLEVANTQVGGRPLFGGTTASVKAYDASGTYLGDGTAVAVPVSPGVTSTVSATGPAVFGNPDPVDPAAGDIFQLLEHLASAVESGDVAQMQGGLGAIDAASTRVQTVQVQIGSRARQLDDVRYAAQVSETDLRSSISQLEDADLAETMITMKSREAAYQAALAVTATAIQPSLLDFLR